MNIKELKGIIKANKSNVLKETIAEIERRMILRANNGLSDIQIYPDSYSCSFLYTINKWMFEPLKDYFINEGYKVQMKEIKTPIKWIEKLLRIYEPEYLMIISWEDVNEPLEVLKRTVKDINRNTTKIIKECDRIHNEINDKIN